MSFEVVALPFQEHANYGIKTNFLDMSDKRIKKYIVKYNMYLKVIKSERCTLSISM